MKNMVKKFMEKLVEIILVVVGIMLTDNFEEWLYYNVYPGTLSSPVRVAHQWLFFVVITMGLLFVYNMIINGIKRMLADRKLKMEIKKEMEEDYREFIEWRRAKYMEPVMKASYYRKS